MNNILEELGNKFLKNSKEIELTLPIKDSKIEFYGLFFCSAIHPFYNKIIEKLVQFYINVMKNENNFELIFISCDDTEEDFKAIINDIEIEFAKYIKEQNNENISSWLTLPFDIDDSKSIKKKIFEKYNITSIPTIILNDKEGKFILSLKNSDIFELDEKTIEYWKNLIKERKKGLGNTKFMLGSIGYSNSHRHPLIYSDYTTKTSGYSSGWNCDECGVSFTKSIPNFYCMKCSYDICDSCYEKINNSFR